MQVRRKGVLSQQCALLPLACFSICGQKIVWIASCLLTHFREFTLFLMTLTRIFPNKAKEFHVIYWVLWLTGCSKKTVYLRTLRYSDLKKAASQAAVPFNVIFPFNL